MKALLSFCILLGNVAMAAYPQPMGLWQFDDPANLTKSVIGSDLVETGTHTAVAGMNAGDGAVRDGFDSYYRCNHGIAPNGGGIYTNRWTLLLDVKLPASSAGQWVSLYQTNTSNSNDGDCFISPSRTIGVSATGYSANVLPSETWSRVVISVSNPNFYRIYVNGVKWREGTVQSLDGRFALESAVLLFADEDDEDYPIDCTQAAIWGQALTDAEVSTLGGPSNPIQFSISNYVGMNLLTNPSAEEDLSGWTLEDGVDWQATDRTDWHFPFTGNYYFTPGRTAFGHISQIIRLDFLASEIDSGIALAQTGGLLGGGNDADQGRILVEYLDASDTLLAATDSGWLQGSEGMDWLLLELPGAAGFVIPAGTRSVRFNFMTQRMAGVDCDVFGDDFVWEYRLAGSNLSPAVPSLAASASTAAIGTNITFTFASVDPDADDVSYQMNWGDQVSSWSGALVSGTDYVIAHAWQTPGTYLVRVRSRDANGGVSEWSLPYEVVITGQAAGVFKSYPYLQNVSQDAITIVWETDRVVLPTVDWGLTAAYGNQAQGLCINVASGVYICKVRITGLSAETQYHYRARSGSTLSSDAVFTTAVNSQTPFRFSVWGDAQRETVNPAVSNAMFTDMSAAVDFGITTGDIAENSDYATFYSNPFRKYFCNIFARQKPAFVAFGNHDEPESSILHKAVQNSGMRSFSFNYGNAHFTCIDYSQCNDNTLPYDGSISSLPIEWLQQDLSSEAAQNAAWRFVFLHIPPYSERWVDGSSILRNYLAPLLNQYRVHICFSGHVHEYERGYLEGTYYIITGCGSYLDTVEPIVKDWPHMTVGGAHNINSFVGGCVNGYAIVDINDTELTLSQHAYNANGTYYGVIDTVRIVQADFTRDGVVDIRDFAVLAAAWQTTPQDAGWNPDCDLADQASQRIDGSDLTAFLSYWLIP